jgi:hypothetical protein
MAKIFITAPGPYESNVVDPVEAHYVEALNHGDATGTSANSWVSVTEEKDCGREK